MRGQTITIVDTGTPPFAGSILRALRDQGMSPDDVEYLVVTHQHQDHWRNVGLFPKATLIADHNVTAVDGRVDVYREHIPHPDVVIFDTTGHTIPHYSVKVEGLWNGREARIVIAGDAIREDLVRNGYYVSSRAKPGELSSAQKCLEADVVIPGHYDVLESERIAELRALLSPA